MSHSAATRMTGPFLSLRRRAGAFPRRSARRHRSPSVKPLSAHPFVAAPGDSRGRSRGIVTALRAGAQPSPRRLLFSRAPSSGRPERTSPVAQSPGRLAMTRHAFTAAALAIAAMAAQSDADLKLPRISPDAKVTQTVGLTDLTV